MSSSRDLRMFIYRGGCVVFAPLCVEVVNQQLPSLLIDHVSESHRGQTWWNLLSAGCLMLYQYRPYNIRLFWGFVLLVLLRICYPRQHHKMPNSGFYETASRRSVDSSPTSQVIGSAALTAGSAWCPGGLG